MIFPEFSLKLEKGRERERNWTNRRSKIQRYNWRRGGKVLFVFDFYSFIPLINDRVQFDRVRPCTTEYRVAPFALDIWVINVNRGPPIDDPRWRNQVNPRWRFTVFPSPLTAYFNRSPVTRKRQRVKEYIRPISIMEAFDFASMEPINVCIYSRNKKR